LLEPLKMH